ncbi:MAG: N-acetyltransferase [Caulobacterales bacterium]
MSIQFHSEKAEHGAAIEAVLDRAFGPGRFAKTSERVREQGAVFLPEISRVAFAEGAIAGVCRMWRIAVGGRPALFLGPLAVDPGAQHHGLGGQLVRECAAAGRAAGESAIILVGAAAFFQPLGFSLIPQGAISLPGPVNPQRFLWTALRPGGTDALEGPVTAPY